MLQQNKCNLKNHIKIEFTKKKLKHTHHTRLPRLFHMKTASTHMPKKVFFVSLFWFIVTWLIMTFISMKEDLGG